MNCHDIATTLEATLLRQRSPEWLRDAYRHADQCPSCARLMALHRLETQMTEVPAIGPSKDFVQSVMSRISRREPVGRRSPPPRNAGVVEYFAICLGVLALAAVYCLAADRESWLSNLLPVKPWLRGLFPSAELARTVGRWIYFAYHPWVLLLGVAATLLLALGLAGRGCWPDGKEQT